MPRTMSGYGLVEVLRVGGGTECWRVKGAGRLIGEAGRDVGVGGRSVRGVLRLI